MLCAAPHYIEQHGLPETAEDVARQHQIGFVLASTGRSRPGTLARDGRKVEIDVPARFVTTDSAAALSAGLDGMGIIVLAEFVASHYLTSGALVRVLPGWRCPSLPLHLVTPTLRKRAARVTGLHGLGARPAAPAPRYAARRPLNRAEAQTACTGPYLSNTTADVGLACSLCRTAPGREFQFADCADSRPWSVEFAHRKSASGRGPVLTLAAKTGPW